MKKYLLPFLLTLNIYAQGTQQTNLSPFDDITQNYEDGELKLRTQLAIGVIVQLSAIELTKLGHNKEAKELKEQWQVQGQRYFSNNLSIYELGDYGPLNQWLADWYKKIEAKIPARIIALTNLEDIKIINYGMPVVFDPANDLWDKEEYKLHFVPFTAVVSFWSFKVGCLVSSLDTIPGLFCDLAASRFRKVMQRRVGPRLSDRVYDRAHDSVE